MLLTLIQYNNSYSKFRTEEKKLCNFYWYESQTFNKLLFFISSARLRIVFGRSLNSNLKRLYDALHSYYSKQNSFYLALLCFL